MIQGETGYPAKFKMQVHAARPTLFNATADPDLVISVLLANLMSDRLWELAERIVKPDSSLRHEDNPARIFSKIQKYANSRFYHARPMEFAAIWGLHEREYILHREDLEANDYAMDVIAGAYRYLKQKRPWGAMLLEFLKMGLFPEYVYPTVDIILAHGPLLSDRPTRPIGLTSCADECILIASLALALGCCRLDEIVFLCSPFHYTLFLFPKGTDGFWFNAKREYFDAENWRRLNRGASSVEIGETFMSRMVVFDRVITPYGYCVFPQKKSTMARQQIDGILGKIHRFVGTGLAELSPSVAQGLPETGDFPERGDLPPVAECGSAGAVRTCLAAIDETRCPPAFALSRYSFRSLAVSDLRAYTSAALKGYKVWIRSAEVLTVEHGVDLVRAISGRESVFGSTQRIAFPDEVLYFGTASEDERVLFLFALLMLSPVFSASEKAGFEIAHDGGAWSLSCFGHRWFGHDL